VIFLFAFKFVIASQHGHRADVLSQAIQLFPTPKWDGRVAAVARSERL
jgi:hypothetical protein